MQSVKKKVGKYIITSMIAKGGMGKIYKARHPTLNRDVILKHLTLVGNKTIKERFKREAELMIDFREDRIVQVYDHFREGGSYYIVMEYIDGISLGELVDEKRYLPNEIAMMIFYEICKALKYAHDNGVIHRDIKPENILISKDGAVKLTDFGIATSKDSQDECLTKNMTLGTPAYMSPEQISDSSTVDRRADIYSMGVLLYKMLTGKCPYPGDMTPETINAIHKGKYKAPGKINPGISKFNQGIIKKAMNRFMRKRYRDLSEVICLLEKQLKKYKDKEKIEEALKTYIDKDQSAKKTERFSKQDLVFPRRSYKKRILAASLGLIILLAGLAYWAYEKGYHYELFKTGEMGAFTIELKVPKKKGADINYANARLLYKQKNWYKPLEDAAISFNKTKQPRVIYSSGRVYGKTGEYRVQVNADNVVYNRDFFLKSRSVQRHDKNNFEPEIISIVHTPSTLLPVAVRYTVRDSKSGETITGKSEMFIKYGRIWIPWKDFTANENFSGSLLSGRKYRFLFKSQGYITKFLTVPVERHQSIIDLKADLLPVPGTLYVKSNMPGIEMQINNSSHYINGGKNKKINMLKPLEKKYQQFVLSPGSYFLTTYREDVKKVAEVRINSYGNKRVSVVYNENANTIDYKIF
ncbi:MAG: serine/threonine protein kinase [bacterium]|nr:serine/threonine protein kinase [bacterium]